MPDRSDLWYRLGYALESARQGQARASLEALTGPPSRRGKDGRSTRPRPVEGSGDPASGALDLLLAAGTGTLVSRVLAAWPARQRPTLARLVKAAAAGAGATLLRELVRPLLNGSQPRQIWDEQSIDRLSTGAARGLIYGGILAPRLPGPALARGIVYGATEYLLSPWGGLRTVLGKHAPYRRLPVVSSLFEGPQDRDEAFLDHLVYGVALGLLYGDDGGPARIGIADADE